MQYYYGDKNILRALDEAEFWKHQEIEHTTVIQLVTPGLESEYVQGLKGFETEFTRKHAEIVQYIESVTRSNGNFSNELYSKMIQVIQTSIQLSMQFIEYLNMMLGRSSAVEANTSSQTVINHIIRESQYFIGIDQLILY